MPSRSFQRDKMSRFASDLNVSVSYDPEQETPVFKLLTPFVFLSDFLLNHGQLWTIEVPVGFETDFASVPRFPIIWDIAGGVGNKAATIHDYLYTEHTYDRMLCDRVFREALKVEGVGTIKRNLMYASVRILGQAYWDKQ